MIQILTAFISKTIREGVARPAGASCLTVKKVAHGYEPFRVEGEGGLARVSSTYTDRVTEYLDERLKAAREAGGRGAQVRY